jgi:hypothetical protein
MPRILTAHHASYPHQRKSLHSLQVPLHLVQTLHVALTDFRSRVLSFIRVVLMSAITLYLQVYHSRAHTHTHTHTRYGDIPTETLARMNCV